MKFYRIIAGFLFGFALLFNAETVLAQNREQAASIPVPAVQKSLCDGLVFVPVTLDGRSFQICLKPALNDELDYIVSDTIGFDTGRVPVTLSIANLMITNKQYRPLHKQILEWGGAGFEKIRVRMAGTIIPISIGSNNLISMQSGKNSIILAKNKDLRELGYLDRASALLDPVLARYPGKKKKLSDGAQWEWTSFTIAKATNLIRQGKFEEAMQLYQDFEQQSLVDQDLKANTAVNRAAYLAEAGRYEEAISALDLAETAYGAQVPSYSNIKVGGSDREFMWIRACALHGTGKLNEAKLLTDKLYAMPEQPTSYFASLTSTAFIKRRLAFCMDDADALVGLLQQDYSKYPSLPTSATLTLQKGYQFDAIDRSALLQRVRDDPRLRDIMALVEQVAPEQMPAINAWRLAPVMPRVRKQSPTSKPAS